MIASAPQQKFFALGDPRALSLLLCWPAVRAAFPNTTDGELRSWIGGSELPWCFNLGVGEQREFICVLTSSVSVQQSEIKGVLAHGHRSKIQNWSDAIKAALPPTQSFFSSALARHWNISADQMDLLVPLIGCVPKNYQSNEPRLLLRTNAETFLNSRAIKFEEDSE